MPRKHKYGAKRTEVDGIVFASQREAKRYGELKLLERAGQISSLTLQAPFSLWVHGRSKAPIGKYIADFQYWDEAKGHVVVEDVKGFKTPLYRWKKKHVEAQYGITIVEV